MSQLIEELAGKTVRLVLEEEELTARILAVDDEWIKCSYTDKEEGSVTRLLRVDNVEEIRMLPGEE